MNYKLLADTVFHRLSHRRYEREGLSAENITKIREGISELVPLYPDIKTIIEVLPSSAIQTIMLWCPKDVILLYSEDKEGYLENAGFLLGQLDLYIQSLGLGTCYIGLARASASAPDIPGFTYVITLAVGNTRDNFRTSISDFKRKPLAETVPSADERFIPMQLAASSMNTQSWYLTETSGVFNLYRRQISRSKDIRRMNFIDVGIALSHIYVNYPESFSVEKSYTPPTIDGFDAVLGFKI